MKEVTGWHVFAMFATGFAIIIGVNMALAYNAVRTFPGLEVKNSYVASQSFEENRDAQLALGWQPSAQLDGDILRLAFDTANGPAAPTIQSATFGRATTVASDQTPDFTFNGQVFEAKVNAGPGNWNLRIVARADDGTLFTQRIIVTSTQ